MQHFLALPDHKSDHKNLRASHLFPALTHGRMDTRFLGILERYWDFLTTKLTLKVTFLCCFCYCMPEHTRFFPELFLHFLSKMLKFFSVYCQYYLNSVK